MIKHTEIEKEELRRLIFEGAITLGGYAGKKIFGTLDCASGKRMKRESRVFFADRAEAEANGYRPCNNCLNAEYKKWKERQT